MTAFTACIDNPILSFNRSHTYHIAANWSWSPRALMTLDSVIDVSLVFMF